MIKVIKEKSIPIDSEKRCELSCCVVGFARTQSPNFELSVFSDPKTFDDLQVLSLSFTFFHLLSHPNESRN